MFSWGQGWAIFLVHLFFLALRLCKTFLAGNSLHKNFLTSKSKLMFIVERTCLIFPPWLPLHDVISGVFAVKEFFGDIAPPPS